MNGFRLGSIAATCVGLTFPSVARAEGVCAKRPLGDFLAAQGTTSMFVPPVPDYVGWADGALTTFALIDYAGLANTWIESQTGESLGTSVSGKVQECARREGGVEVRVQLRTTNALAWAFLLADIDPNDPLPFLNTPLAFGARAQDVVNGAEPALGKVSFTITFTNSSRGAPLPDLVQLINSPTPAQLPLTFSFRSQSCGTLPDGTPARLRVWQVCSTVVVGSQVCAEEIVKIDAPAPQCDQGD